MTARDAGSDLRRALGLSEPSYVTHPGSQYRNPAYHGGFRDAEDERDFAEVERRMDEREAQEERAALVPARAA